MLFRAREYASGCDFDARAGFAQPSFCACPSQMALLWLS
jgi:hypothetical protein